MADQDVTRRRFLVASIACSGLISSGLGTAFLRAGSAWAQEAKGTANELARMARLLFPHDGVADDVYAEIIDDVLSASADDASMTAMLNEAITALDSAAGGDWFGAAEDQQIAAMQAVEGEAFFAAIVGNVRARFYNHPQVWEHVGYPGSSVEFGGYVDRGFDDIDWLPGDA